jgi:hypothetical protein
VDSRAELLGPAASFAAWAEPVLDAVGADGFIARRVQAWGLFKALQSGAPVDRVALAAASNWLQRKVTSEADSAVVLTALGEVGRTKRVRNLAKTRAGRPRSRSRPSRPSQSRSPRHITPAPAGAAATTTDRRDESATDARCARCCPDKPEGRGDHFAARRGRATATRHHRHLSAMHPATALAVAVEWLLGGYPALSLCR